MSSCTQRKEVAHRFLGGSGMLFSIKPRRAVSIRAYSAFQDEDELVIKPGTRLRVARVQEAKGICNVTLEELDEAPLVS